MKTVKMQVLADNPMGNRFDGRPVVLTPSRCLLCAHLYFNSYVRQCSAFPDGIPEALWEGEHTSPVEGDHGIQYRRRELGEPPPKIVELPWVEIEVQVEHD